MLKNNHIFGADLAGFGLLLALLSTVHVQSPLTQPASKQIQGQTFQTSPNLTLAAAYIPQEWQIPAPSSSPVIIDVALAPSLIPESTASASPPPSLLALSSNLPLATSSAKPISNPTATPVPTPLATPTPPPFTPPPGSLNADRIFEMVNTHRESINLPDFQKDDRACTLAASRAPEIDHEIASGIMHRGLRERNLSYWNTENIISMDSEQAAFNWWVHDKIHKDAIEGDYKYSCVACSGQACAEEFTNFQSK